MQYHQKHSGLAFFDEVVNEDEFLEFLIEWSDSIVPPENMVNTSKSLVDFCETFVLKSSGHPDGIIKHVNYNQNLADCLK